MSSSSAMRALSKERIKTTSGIRETSPKVIFNGLVKLIEGQKSFSEEFGLPYDYVFSKSGDTLKQGSTALVLKRLLKNGDSGTEQLSQIVADVLSHYLAMHQALDGIASETLRQLDPVHVRQKSYRIFLWRPFAWLSFKRKHKVLMQNSYLRHHEVVVAGLCKGYVTAKTEFMNINDSIKSNCEEIS